MRRNQDPMVCHQEKLGLIAIQQFELVVCSSNVGVISETSRLGSERNCLEHNKCDVFTTDFEHLPRVASAITGFRGENGPKRFWFKKEAPWTPETSIFSIRYFLT